MKRHGEERTLSLIAGGLRRGSSAAFNLGALRRNATSDEVIDAEASSMVATVVGLVLFCTLLANLVKRIETSKWQCPESILAIILGFFASMPLCSATTRPGKDFDTIFFLYLVPPILFESGYSLKQRDFFRNFTAICLFAVLGTVISSLVAGMGLFYLAQGNLISGLDGASPKEGLLFGTLLSATDTVATIAVLRQMGVDPQLYALIFGESVLNDAVAVVLFQTVDSLSDAEADFHVSGQALLATIARFVGVFVGSVSLGVVFGLLTALITKRVIKDAHAPAEVTVMICMAYLAFIVADDLKLSGLMAVFFAGVVMSHYAKYNLSQHGQHTTQHVARTLSHLGELLTFMYFGFTILPVLNPSCASADGQEHLYRIEWSFVFWTLVMCVLSRGAAVLPLTAVVNLLKSGPRQRVNRISTRSMLMMWFCILRGAVAFALSLTIQSPNRQYMIPCIVMVVLFTNLILGQATVPVLRILKIPIGIVDEEDVDCNSPERARPGGFENGANTFSAGVSQVGRLHSFWRRVDELYIKPLFGGRKRGAYRVQTGYDEGPEGRTAPMLGSDNGDFDYVPHTSQAYGLGPEQSGAGSSGGVDSAGVRLRLRPPNELELTDMRSGSPNPAHRQRLAQENGDDPYMGGDARLDGVGRPDSRATGKHFASERFRKWWAGRGDGQNGARARRSPDGHETGDFPEAGAREDGTGNGAEGRGKARDEWQSEGGATKENLLGELGESGGRRDALDVEDGAPIFPAAETGGTSRNVPPGDPL